MKHPLESRSIFESLGELWEERPTIALAAVFRAAAGILFACMALAGLVQWWSYLQSTAHAAQPLTGENFDITAKCLVGLVGVVLVDISMSLSALRRK
jgi:hypothetical protein